jgi:hypothetical protein
MIEVANADSPYDLSHIIVPIGKYREFEGESLTGVTVHLIPPVMESADAIIDASGGGGTSFKIQKMTFIYDYSKRIVDYFFIKFSSSSGKLTIENIALSSPTPAGENKHQTGLIKIESGSADFTNVSFKNIIMEKGSVINTNINTGNKCVIDGCSFSDCKIMGDNGGGSCIHAYGEGSLELKWLKILNCGAGFGGGLYTEVC